MTTSLDKKETYLYGTLLALAQEQLDAIEKKIQGRLGFWGKSRMSARNHELTKFLLKIIEHKVGKGSVDPLSSLVDDLELIEADQQVWNDISADQLEYVRNVLAMSAP